MSNDEPVDTPLSMRWQEPLPWQQAALRSCLSRRMSWPHAALIYGQRGIGKKVFALNIARALLCETPRADGLACGHCPSCHYVAHGQHPDLMLIEPIVQDDDGVEKIVDWITVERIRELIRFAQLTPHRQHAKVALFVPAEAMNAQASNALLKTLEEPPGVTRLILLSHAPYRLAPTVLSRCTRFPAPRPSAAEAGQWLALQGVSQPDMVLAQGGGAPLFALELSLPSIQTERDALVSDFAHPERLSPTAVGARLEAAPRAERKARLQHLIDALLAWTHDLARVVVQGTPYYHPDQAGTLARLAPRVASIPLFRYHRALLQQRALLSHPLQPRWIAEKLLFDYCELFVKNGLDQA